ncbi:hypothetical protein EYF80_003571 [Liparis tanakae]|uniref:Uncharacterized protein n=1 Tax=Liparis tanakae TaxID=230148 RepID=A0A4Z2J8H3_9TELE|nr:hypothetical protein EYF80_003571 [Liparis tanakae]
MIDRSSPHAYIRIWPVGPRRYERDGNGRKRRRPPRSRTSIYFSVFVLFPRNSSAATAARRSYLGGPGVRVSRRYCGAALGDRAGEKNSAALSPLISN